MQQIVQSGPLLNDNHITSLEIGYTADDVKEALLSIDGTKAPGVDSSGAQYEYIILEVVGEDIIQAMLDFSGTGEAP